MGSDGGHFRCCCYFPASFKKRSTSFICFFLSGGEERIQGERMNLSSMCQAGLRCEEPSVAHNVSLVESVFALHVSQSARASDWAAQATEIHVLTALGVEVQDRVATRVGFWWGLTSWLVDGWLLAVSSRGLSSVCVRRGLSHVRAPTPQPQLTLITSPKAASPNTVTLALRAST